MVWSQRIFKRIRPQASSSNIFNKWKTKVREIKSLLHTHLTNPWLDRVFYRVCWVTAYHFPHWSLQWIEVQFLHITNQAFETQTRSDLPKVVEAEEFQYIMKCNGQTINVLIPKWFFNWCIKVTVRTAKVKLLLKIK